MDHYHHHHHFHRELAKRKPDDVTQDGTVYSVVYVTATPTFTGIIGGYTTLTDNPATQQTEASLSSSQALTSAAVASSVAPSSYAVETSASVSVDQSSAVVSSSLESSAGQSSAFTSAVQATSALSTLQTYSTATPSVASASNTADGATSTESSASGSGSALSSDSGSNSSGMSTGAKAGIAIGVIAAIGLLAVFLLWLLGKKRRQREEMERTNEKPAYDMSRPAGPVIQTSSSTVNGGAPRLSLRPMSRMMDGFLGASNRRSGNLLDSIGEDEHGPGHSRGLSPLSQPATPTSQQQEKQQLENPFADPQNPFQDPVAAPATPEAARTHAPGPAPITAPSVVAKLSSQQSMPDSKSNPNNVVAPQSKVHNVDASSTTSSTTAIQLRPVAAPAPLESSVAKSLAAAGVAGVAGAASVAAAAHNGSSSARSPSPEDPLPIQKPSSPEPSCEDTDLVSTPPTVTDSQPSPALSGSSNPPPGGNVYRVLMDFSPSMDDELELKTGQLIRLLHEYDDGWALCIRLDRSQQGVVPRTCLAAKPSKPKPSHLNQYARGPGPHSRPMSPAGVPRPMSPAGRNGRSASPGMGRPMSPGMGPPMSPSMGRPMSPGMGRPMSPGMGRPMSPGMGRPMSPGMGRSMSPGAGRPIGPPRRVPGRPMSPAHNRPMSPGAFNQPPRPLSPGPRPYKRSQSPGPYGVNGPAPMHDVEQRRRSNSASALNARERRTSPLGPSNLGPASRPLGQPYRPMSPGIAL